MSETESANDEHDELRSEYSEALWKQGVRGKYAEQYSAASNVVRVAPDLATLFPNEESVNEALRKFLNESDLQSHESSNRSDVEDVGQFFGDYERLAG